MKTYTCPMHKEIILDKPGTCPKCGMTLVPKDVEMNHGGHEMKPTEKMTFWEKFKMSMTMSMGMEHTGLAGREMAKMLEPRLAGLEKRLSVF